MILFKKLSFVPLELVKNLRFLLNNVNLVDGSPKFMLPKETINLIFCSLCIHQKDDKFLILLALGTPVVALFALVFGNQSIFCYGVGTHQFEVIDPYLV